jgi:hypothetical protein
MLPGAAIDGRPTRGRDRGLEARKNRVAQSAKATQAGIMAGGAEKCGRWTSASTVMSYSSRSGPGRARHGRRRCLKRDEIGMNRHRACLSMIFSENRFTLLRIIL